MSDVLKQFKIELEKVIKSSSKVFIVGHNEPDFDSIASSIALKAICDVNGVESYIIIDDEDIELEPGVKKIKDENKDFYNIITLDEYQKLKTKNQLLLVTDVNKKHMIPVKDCLDDFKKIAIIDHHEEDERTIQNAIIKQIDTTASSASEMVAQVLATYRNKTTQRIGTYLLAGIFLDTKRFIKNTTPRTHDVVEKLLKKGADADYVNELFLVEFDEDRKINDLVFNGTVFQNYEYTLFHNHNVSFTLNRNNKEQIYRKEEIAKAADKMLKYRVDAAFVLGYVKPGVITISARSKNSIDVGKVMNHMNGGGNAQNAGGRIESDDIEEVERNLMQMVQWGFNIPEIPDEVEPSIQKIKKKREK